MLYCHIFSFFMHMHFVFASSDILFKEDLHKARLFFNASTLEEGVKEQRWVCTGPEDRVSIQCDDLGVNELEGPKKELQIDIKSKKYIHEYGLRHGILKRECERIKREIQKLLAQSKKVCFRGQFVSADLAQNPILIGWVFDEVKNNVKSICEFNECD